LLLACALAVVAGASASSAGSVHGAVFTTINVPVDGPHRCLNGPGVINCNIYTGKQFVWLNGGPAANMLRPAGQYFFAVGEPGFQSNPNDGSAKNLSCAGVGCLDPHSNRTFTVGSNGEITSYGGTHQQSPGSGGLLLRLCLAGCPPYADTTNNGGEYVMAVCYLGRTGTTYPVGPSDCKYDNFKVRATQPPVCSLIATISGPPKKIQVMVQAADFGLASIDVLSSHNANTIIPAFAIHPQASLVVTSTKINQNQASTLALRVTDLAGVVTLCDPVVPGSLARAHHMGGPRAASRLRHLR
jgi:hypothetical protein